VLPIYTAVSSDSNGRLYFLNANIASWAVGTLASTNIDLAPGKISSSYFISTTALSVDGNGMLWVGDAFNRVYNAPISSGTVSLYLGCAMTSSVTCGPVSYSALGSVTSIAAYTANFGDRVVYVADSTNYRIIKVNNLNAASVLAGSGSAGAQDGSGTSASFGKLAGMAVDNAGNVYAVDTTNHAVRKISPAGVVTTFAGALGQAGNVDGLGTTARFNAPTGLSIDASGNLFVADTGNHEIRKITPSGQVSTVAGAAGRSGTLAQTGLPGVLYAPTAVTVLPSGQLVIADGPGLYVTQGGQFQ